MHTVAEHVIHDISDLLNNTEADIVNSIGGSSYNIAVNLALGGVPGGSALFSYLPPNTTTSHLIVQRLKQIGVSTRYVRKERTINGRDVTAGGFVAIRDKGNGQLFICGVEEVMGDHDLMAVPQEEALIKAAISRCKAVVMDTGLNSHSIARITKIAADKSIPVFIHSVSAKKVSNYKKAIEGVGSLIPGPVNLCIVGKAPELDALHWALGAPASDQNIFIRRFSGDTGGSPPHLDVAAICDRLRTKYILVTPRAVEDAYLLAAKPAREYRIHHGLTMPGNEGSLLGVSEAIGASLIHCFCEQPRRVRANHQIDRARRCARGGGKCIRSACG